MKLRKARNSDVGQIRALINEMAARVDEDFKHGHMLPRALTELYENVRDYTVLVDEDELVLGCCALHSCWDSLAELKALAVNDSVQGQGWGRKLVDAALAESEALGLDCVFTLTNKWEFFQRLGFEAIDMRKLPQRVWSECTNCPKFMVACDEVAMTFGGKQPKQTYIPAIGVNASPAAQAALGLIPSGRVPGGPMNMSGFSPPFGSTMNGNGNNGKNEGS